LEKARHAYYLSRRSLAVHNRIEISRVVLGTVFHRELLALTRRKIESKEIRSGTVESSL